MWVIQNYYFKKKLKYFTFDNFTSYDTYIKIILSEIWPDFIKKNVNFIILGKLLILLFKLFCIKKIKKYSFI